MHQVGGLHRLAASIECREIHCNTGDTDDDSTDDQSQPESDVLLTGVDAAGGRMRTLLKETAGLAQPFAIGCLGQRIPNPHHDLDNDSDNKERTKVVMHGYRRARPRSKAGIAQDRD